MCENTREANRAGDYLGQLREFADDQLLVIHTDRSGEIAKDDLDVALKDCRARRWCEDATRLAGRTWAYEKVGQVAFDAYTGGDLDGLRRFIAANDDQP